MMTRRRFALLLAGLPLVGKLFVQSTTLVDPRQWSYPPNLSKIVPVGEFSPAYFPTEVWRAGPYSQAVLDVVDGKTKVKGVTDITKKRTWRLRSADGTVRAFFSSSESAEWYKNKLFAMTIDMDESAAVWATDGQLTGQQTGWMFHQIGPRFVNLEAATEWMKGLTITKGE